MLLLCLLLLMVMVKVFWVLGPPTLTPIKDSVVLLVIILCHIGVVFIHP